MKRVIIAIDAGATAVAGWSWVVVHRLLAFTPRQREDRSRSGHG